MNEEDYEPVKIDGVKCIAVNKFATAICCAHNEWDKPVWIAYSLIHENSEVYKRGDEGILIVPRWLARKENML